MYQVYILPRALKQLAAIHSPYFEKIESSINDLSSHPRPHGSKKLVARAGWRLRVNDYRIVYEINDKGKKVTVLDIGHRRLIYN